MSKEFNLNNYLEALSKEDHEPNNYSIKKEWCFIRLYTTEYNKEIFHPAKILRVGNKLISDKASNGKFYTHAAINYSLSDHFVGLNLMKGDPNSVQIEVVKNWRKGDERYERQDSTFDVFAIPLYKNERELLKFHLNKIITNNHFKYDVKTLLLTALLICKRKAQILMGFSKENIDEILDEEGDSVLSEIKKGMVCSTFVAFILKNVSADFARWLRETKRSEYEFAPNTLTHIPNIEYLFGGSWNGYARALTNFTKKNPEFAKYIN